MSDNPFNAIGAFPDDMETTARSSTEALATLTAALRQQGYEPHADLIARDILAALPEGWALIDLPAPEHKDRQGTWVTTDSLAAALLSVDPPMSPDEFTAEADAAAIIFAAKEAER